MKLISSINRNESKSSSVKLFYFIIVFQSCSEYIIWLCTILTRNYMYAYNSKIMPKNNPSSCTDIVETDSEKCYVNHEI